ncbi:MAG: hypothetical protein Q4F72_07850, partial [Desulfovibrionaceae bacterium]|nr:hypothetical protein [Desulfovibrionaceae bacterium]
VDEYGRARLTPRSDTDHSLHAQVRCGWMSGYFGGEDGDGRPFYPQAHMEAGRFSTVEVRLSQEPRPGDQPGYRQICQRARNAALRKGENSFFRIQSQAAGAVMDAWRQDRAEHPDIRFGTLHITTWYPEEHFRFGLEDRKGNGRRQLAAFLADSRFAAQPSEDGTPAPAAVTPELILRFLTEDGSVAGVWRCRPKDLAPSLQGADGEPISWQDAAKAQAERVFARFIGGLAPDYVKSRAITGVDVLPGRRYLCSRAVHTPSPLPDGSENRAAMTQLRSLLYLGLSQGEGVHQSQRFSIGCTQAFVPRGRHDHVLGWHQLRDGVSLRSAALLMPGGEMLVPAGAYREEVDREQSYMTGMTALLEESREDGPSAGMGTPDWSEDPEDNARGVETDRHMRACPAQVRAQVAEFASGSDGGRTAAGRAKDSRAAARAGSSATIRSAAAGAGRGDEDTGPRCA